ncbi:uncharacterized protein [Henckelia pumila]|uniref:uncharacterized protein n=1 Tax=Henckelia pumila TaxID=405737 RepID=UPI003C6E71DB
MIRTRHSKDLVPLDLEIESTLLHIRKSQKQVNLVLESESDEDRESDTKSDIEMAVGNNNRTVLDLIRLFVDGFGSSIVHHAVEANNFDLKPAIIQMIQLQARFGGATVEDPYAHLKRFLHICGTFKFNGVTVDIVRLRLFPFSLQGDATEWLTELPASYNTTWTELVQDFLNKCSCRWKFTAKSSEDGYELIEEMTSSSYHPLSERSAARKSNGIHQVDAFTSVAAQLEVMNKRIEELSIGNSVMRVQEVWCEKCGAEHFTKDCQTFSQPKGVMNNKPYENQNYSRQPQEGKSSLEQMMQQFISSTETRMQNQDASIKNLENQIRKLAKTISGRDQGTLPSDTEKNPKEQVKEIELRSGKTVEPAPQVETELELATSTRIAGKSSIPTLSPTSQAKIVVPPPFPAALKKAKLDSQFGKFLEVFKKLNINIPFADALMQMPSYAKFLKEILSNKRKLEEHAMISLTENCSALVQNKIPLKQKDPGSFSIPCVINDIQFHKALCDLGASINLMPYSVFRKLSLGEPKSTRMSLQLADRSIKYPRGIIEDVLVKVDKFIFPVDFMVLDMEEDLDMPLILGRPFLATGKALIDV